MRLTLRTLLAYLDDLLTPAETKEMGRKIAESPSGAQMRDRIKDVLRRRRVEAPALGADPDPNRVAEYLDNLLSPEDTAEHERVCLASDPVLAETAACHQILTLVLGQPVDVPASVRRRLVGLSESDRPGEGSAMIPVGSAASFQLPPEEDGPPAAKSRPWGRWAAAAAAVLALAAVFAVVLRSDDALTGRDVAAREPFRPGLAAAAAPAGVPGGDVPADAAPEADAEMAGAEMSEAADVGESDVPPGDGLPPGVDEVPVETAAADAPDEPAMEEAVAKAGEPPAVEPPAPKAEPFAFAYASEAGVTLEPNDEVGGWAPVGRGAALPAGDELIVPRPFEAEVAVSGGPGESDLRVTLSGGAHAVLLGPSEELGGGLRLIRGRAKFRNDGQSPATLRLAAGPETGLTLGPGAVALAEVAPRVPEVIGQTPAGVAAGLVLLSGGASAGDLSKAADAEPAAAALAGDPDLGAIAEWGGRTDDSTLTRRYAAMFARLLPPGTAVDQALPAVLDEPVYRMSELAAEALSLLDDAPAMVAGLGSVHSETRRACVRGLRAWLAEDPSRRDELAGLLSQRYREGVVARLMRLLEGYGREDLRRPSVSRRLVEDLASDEAAVREAAWLIVRRHADRDYDYRPNATAQSRAIAVRRWTDFLDDEAAIVRPAVDEPAEE